MRRFPEIKSSSKRDLISISQVMCSTPKNVNIVMNFAEVMREINPWIYRPRRIYNKPPKIICGSTLRPPQAVISPKIGCGNAAVSALSLYFIFKLICRNDDLVKEILPGTAVSVSKTGSSNSEHLRTAWNYIS